jgi:hypothetical protein
MSLLLNLGNSITAGTDPYQFYNFRERVLADGATVLSDTQVSDEIKRLRSLGLYSKFSALYTPAVRNTSKLYSIISADGDATVTRGSVKNINSVTGTLEEIASDVTPSSFGTGGWGALVEGARTNLLLRSEEFDNATWVKSAATVTANATTAPDGATTADKLVEDATSNAHAIQQGVTVANATVYTYSCFAKKAERKYLRLIGGTGFTASVNFDLDDGSFTITAGTPTVAVQALPNGWYRCSITATTSNTFIQPNVSMTTTAGGTGAYTGDGTSGIFIWGAQLEAGSFASSYMKTEGATFTRSADVITKTGASDLIGQTEGTLFAEIEVSTLLGATGRAFIEVGDGTMDNRYFIAFTGAESNTIRAAFFEGNVLKADIRIPVPTAGIYKVAAGFKSSDSALYVNGVSGIETSNLAFFSMSLNQIVIGALFDGSASLNGLIRSVAISPNRLSNAELIALTT